MLNILLTVVVLLSLLILLSLGIAWGRAVGARHIAKHAEHKLEVVGVAEGAVFALLGLLIAFTFSGAYDRFEKRKIHVIEEADAYTQAYQSIDLLGAKWQKPLQAKVRDYMDLHIAAYAAIPNLQEVFKDLDQAKFLEKQLWLTVVAACEDNPNKGLAVLVLPIFNRMFEEAFDGVALARVHPPVVIFVLLIGLAFLGAFLTGYSTAGGQVKWPIHNWCYVVLTAVTIYVMMNLEFPRVGILRVSSFDDILIYARDNMTDNAVSIEAVENEVKH